MNTRLRNDSGVSMIEMLITLVILMLGLLGLAGLMAQAQRSETESYQRAQAIVILRDMAARLNANRKSGTCYAFTTNAVAGTPYLGTGAGAIPACATGTAEQQARAVQDLTDWSALLAGGGESAGGTNTGAMVGARGCVSFDATDSTYLITVVWQGLNASVAPPASLTCATGLYGSEINRRAVSLTVRIATLT